MQQPLTLARPYARAAFEIASQDGAIDEWARKLELAGTIAADPRVTALFGDPHVSEDEFKTLFLPEGEANDSRFAAFIGLLAENDRLPALPEIAMLYAAQQRDAQQVLKVNVTSAAPIDDGELARLSYALKQRFKCDIELTRSVNADLIGGAIIDAGDVVVDGSVRGRLARLATALTK
ncbi:MAG: F0F1 ATP synthase subunit delta [Rhodanobacteraceae bacterium]